MHRIIVAATLAVLAVLTLAGVASAQITEGGGIDVVPESITFALLLTAAGTGVAAMLVTGTVALIKAVWEAAPVSGAALAFIVSVVLYVVAAIATDSWRDLNLLLIVFISWLTCATSAVGVNQIIAKRALAV